MPDTNRIEVTGLRELRRALKQAEGRSPQELKKASLAAAEAVVPEARRRAPKGKHEGGGTVEPAASSIKARATAGRAYIVFGGTRSPHEPVVNFGGTIPRRGFKGVSLTEKRKGKIISGKRHAAERFKRRTRVAVTRIPRREHIYAALEDKRMEILHAFEQAIGKITKDL